MTHQWRVIVVSSDRSTWDGLSQILSHLHLESSWVSSVEDCNRIFRRDTIDLVFCDECVSDGDYWAVYGAITRGLIVRPKVVLMSRTVDVTECEQAKSCGIFAVIDSPCRAASVEWAVILAKRSARDTQPATPPRAIPKFDVFFGAPDRDAVWVCTVQGLANAKERMDQLATKEPGRYFVFYAPDRSILAQTETFAKAPSKPRIRNESA